MGAETEGSEGAVRARAKAPRQPPRRLVRRVCRSTKGCERPGWAPGYWLTLGSPSLDVRGCQAPRGIPLAVRMAQSLNLAPLRF